ncbi:uncharacterized protein LOC119741495 [Patiria miniata]|uniref:G-protein coupled receptor GRL101 n=1 Tax=Patiria miniata TaxID=46514 RepID=A0A914BCN3_PATMI|nr:uncharacterized protein LOC119741495 [Patiria miniata]
MSGQVSNNTSCWAVPTLCCSLLKTTLPSSIDQFFTRFGFKTILGNPTPTYHDGFVVPRSVYVRTPCIFIITAALFNENADANFTFDLQKIDQNYMNFDVTCEYDEFECDDGPLITCYDSTIVCDGHLDCTSPSDEHDCNYCDDDYPIILSASNSSHDIKYPGGLLRGDPTSLQFTSANCSWTVQASSDQVIRIHFLVPTTHVFIDEFQLNFIVGSQTAANFREIQQPSTVIRSSEVRITFSKSNFQSNSLFLLRLEPEVEVSCEDGTEFSCEPDNVCIPISKRCDGFPDCESKADEIGCVGCSTNEFRCSAAGELSSCESQSYLCDGRPNCPNLYDELNCAICGPPVDLSGGGVYQLTSPRTPKSIQKACVWFVHASSGNLINVRVTNFTLSDTATIFVGSGHDPSNLSSTIVNKTKRGTIRRGFTVQSDRAWISSTVPFSSVNVFTFELTQLNEVVQCNTTTEFACSSGVQCVAADLHCDSVRDCDDYSDELGCFTCDEDQVSCGHQDMCVGIQQICDVFPDCAGHEDEWDCYSTCGQRLVNVNTSAFLTAISRKGREFICAWQITSDLNTYLTVEVLMMEIESQSYITLGNGHKVYSQTSLIANETDRQVAGTLYLLDGNEMWMVASTLYKLDMEVKLSAGEVKGSCDDQSYQTGSKCVSGTLRCDGRADVPDYSDEVDCGFCGETNLNLTTSDEVVTVEVAYGNKAGQQIVTVYVHHNQDIPLVIANTTSNLSECVWKVSSSIRTRIEINVAHFQGTNLRIGNGHDPSAGVPILSEGTLSLPKTRFSSGSALWVATDWQTYEWASYKLQFTLQSYTSIECEDDQFVCHSGTKCLDQSSVCNEIHECSLYTDELNCTSCPEDEFACSKGECIPVDKVCNQNSDCQKLNDEFMCSYCGEPNIVLEASVSRFFTTKDRDGYYDCLWTVTAQPFTRIMVTVLTRTDSDTTFCDGNYGEFVRDSSQSQCTVLAELLRFSISAFLRYITSSGPSLWIKNGGRSFYAGYTLTFTLTQFVDIVCQSDEYKCPSGRTCIDQSAVCDGWPDCPEYEDEMGCEECSGEYLTCAGENACVARSDICDGAAHCQDKSDEFNCGPCGDSLINMTLGFANLTSPGWPGNYLPYLKCYWVALAPEEHRILVIFLEFETSSGYDYLRWSNKITFSQGFTITGSNAPSRIASRGKELSLHFFSNYVDERKGFSLQIEQRPNDQISCGEGEIQCDYQEFVCVPQNTEALRCPKNYCGEEIIQVNSIPEEFSSINYPSASYLPNLYCTWTIIAVQSHRIMVEIVDFDTEPKYDIVTFEGHTFYAISPSTFTMHGNTKVRSIVFNSSSILLSFSTDPNLEKRGFLFSLQGNFSSNEFVSCNMHNDSLFDCEDGSCVSPQARCNGFTDCLHGNDEERCDNIHCPDFYACNASSKCIYWEEVCDGTTDCDFGDDETECDTKRCPDGCKCNYVNNKLQTRCKQGWTRDSISNTAKVTEALELINGNIIALESGSFKGLPRLQALSLANNNIKTIEYRAFDGLNITFLDLSDNNITSIQRNTFEGIRLLETLIMVNVPISYISVGAFSGLSNLNTIAIITKHNEVIEVEVGAVDGLQSLQTLYVDDYRLCCDFAVLPNFLVEGNCRTTELQPPLNLCGSLLQNNVLRVALWILGLSALLGNVVVIIWRIKGAGGRGGKKTHSFMVLNLAISDFMMGVYMLMIAAADLYYGETYFRNASVWRSTVVCKIAGVISVLSSEASVFFVTLISIDCFLCIVFPFSRGIHLRERSTKIVVGLLWFVAVCLSVVPTVSVSPDSNFYGLSDVCIGLPFTTKATGSESIEEDLDTNNPLGSQQLTLNLGTDKKPAWILSVVLFLGVNLVCFLLVFCCYVAIFVSVKRSSKLVRKSAHRNREIKMAVKMALIVGTDFACWMPVIIMGILSQTNTIDIGADMYGWIVVFILPINSSLNPYLYTIYTACTPQTTSNSNSQDKPEPKPQKTRSVETLEVQLSELK